MIAFILVLMTAMIGSALYAVISSGRIYELNGIGQPPLRKYLSAGEGNENADDDAFKYYGIYRSYMEHESSLINFRMTWLLAANGFLFTAFSLVLTKGACSGRSCSVSLEQARALYILISLVGMLVSFLSFHAIHAAKSVAKTLAHHLVSSVVLHTDHCGTQFLELRPGLRVPHIYGAGMRGGQYVGSSASLTIPWIFVISWAYILTTV